MTRHVDGREQQVANLLLRIAVTVDGAADLVKLLLHLVKCILHVIPVKADLCRLLLQLFCTDQTRQALCYAFERLRIGLLMLLLALEVIPVPEDLLGRGDLDIAEDMRVTEDQLFADAVRHVVDVECALFLLHLGVEYHLQQNIAKLFLHMLGVLVVDGFADLVGLLDEVAADRMMILLTVPHAAVRRAQDFHNAEQIIELVTILYFKINHFCTS